jgi:hypothetical protein
MVSLTEGEASRKAESLLNFLGFSDVKRSSRADSPYDFEAIDPEKERCIIEVKMRSPKAKTQFFTIRDTRIRNLKMAAESLGVKGIYFLCMNKFGFKLFTADQLLEEPIPEVRVFKYRRAKERTTGVGTALTPAAKRARTVRVRVDDGLYGFLEDQRKKAGLNGVSETVRFMLQITRFLLSSRLMPYDPDTLSRWVSFLREEGVARGF